MPRPSGKTGSPSAHWPCSTRAGLQGHPCAGTCLSVRCAQPALHCVRGPEAWADKRREPLRAADAQHAGSLCRRTKGARKPRCPGQPPPLSRGSLNPQGRHRGASLLGCSLVPAPQQGRASAAPLSQVLCPAASVQDVRPPGPDWRGQVCRAALHPGPAHATLASAGLACTRRRT